MTPPPQPSPDASHQAPRVDVPPQSGAPASPSLQEQLDQAKLLGLHLLDQVRAYAGIRVDQALLRVKRVALWLAIEVATAVLIVSVMVYSAVLFLSGMSHGLGIWLGGRLWLGEMVTGVLGLFALAAYGQLRVWSETASVRRRLKLKYEARRAARIARAAALARRATPTSHASGPAHAAGTGAP
jgi:hypothetical protein